MLNHLPIASALLWPLLGALALIIVLGIFGQIPISYNLRNLVVRWPITILTAMAFTLVVGILTVMLAFVNGMNKLTEGSGLPGNVMVLSDGATDELFSNVSLGDAADVQNKIAPELKSTVQKDDKGNWLMSKEVYIVANQPVPSAPKERPRRRFIQIRGIDDPVTSARVHGIDLLEGSWFSSAGVQAAPPSPGVKTEGKETAIQVVLGEGIARELGGLHVDDLFELGPNQDAADVRARKWIVVGIMKTAGSTFASEVWAKHGIVGKLFGKENYSSLVLRTQDGTSAQAVAKDLQKTAKVKAQPETEYYASLSETNKQFLYAIIFVAIVMAVGGIFGVMNTMFAAISQRTKDIGVLRILGFSRWQVLVSFFLESMAIALFGGLIGCALGYIVNGWTATSIVSSGAGGGGKSVMLKLVVDGNIIAAGLIFTLVMGALGGLLPSLSAVRLKPLESLR